MAEKEKYYGIKFNGDVPKVDEVNQYSQEVEIEFQGMAYLVERKDNQTQKIWIENGCKLKKEGEYEIEFTNLENETYNLKVRIQTTFWFVILPILTVGIILILVLFSPVKDFRRIARFINLSVLEFDIEDIQESKYEFNVDFKNIRPQEIYLKNTIDANTLSKNKIAPRSKWQFFDFDKYKK